MYFFGKGNSIVMACSRQGDHVLLRHDPRRQSIALHLKYVAKSPDVSLYEGAWKKCYSLKDKSPPVEEDGKPADII